MLPPNTSTVLKIIWLVLRCIRKWLWWKQSERKVTHLLHDQWRRTEPQGASLHVCGQIGKCWCLLLLLFQVTDILQGSPYQTSCRHRSFPTRLDADFDTSTALSLHSSQDQLHGPNYVQFKLTNVKQEPLCSLKTWTKLQKAESW